MMRDLEAAKRAYEVKDESLSRIAHTVNVQLPEEGHKPSGDLIKSIVFGGLDGILTTFALVSGAQGAGLSISAVLILGFSGAVADGIGMGVGDALSSKAETEHIVQERNREFWEYDHFLEEEKAAMVALYTRRGMELSDAQQVVTLMAPHRAFFVDIMTLEDLDLAIPDEDDSPWKDGFVTFCSFVVFGSIPLLGYCIEFARHGNGPSTQALFLVSLVLTALTLFSLGAIKSNFSQKTVWRSGMEMLFIGFLVAGSAYQIGSLTDSWMESRAG